MGRLVEGKWIKQSVITSDDSGSYDREPRSFLDTIGEDHDRFKPEKGRYHLYVSYACPWATRALIMRSLKGLEDYISISVVNPDMLEEGWEFSTDFPGATIDHLYDVPYLRDIYLKTDSDVTTSVTVPVLWDKREETIVNNESSEILRIFNTAFNKLTNNFDDYYPQSLRDEIDKINERVYHDVNNGVYKTGFAQNQETYEENFTKLFDTLDFLETHLSDRNYLVGEQLTEADIRLIVTLLRFDPVYFTHFKCNKKMIEQYENLSRYTREMYRIPAIKNAHHFDHIKRHYYYSHKDINPLRIVPLGPDLNYLNT